MNPTPPKTPQRETLMGQLIAELVRFGGFPKDKASQYARILLPHITAYSAEECTKARLDEGEKIEVRAKEILLTEYHDKLNTDMTGHGCLDIVGFAVKDRAAQLKTKGTIL